MPDQPIDLAPGPRNLITDVDHILVGNAQDDTALTGVSIVMTDPAAKVTASVDTRGGGPGTRETDLLDPACLMDRIDAIALSGGSVFGLDACSGVVSWMAARGRGYAVGPVKAPIVPGAILFDLLNGGDKEWGEEPPYRNLAKQACDDAERNDGIFPLGNIGAGTGAIAGNVKGGLGSASLIRSDGLQVGALVAANPVGLVSGGDQNALHAAAYALDNEMKGAAVQADHLPAELFLPKLDAIGGNTTIAVVATNARLTKAECKRIAIMAHDGLARAIRPLHTPFDGDCVFALASNAWTGQPDGEIDRKTLARIGHYAADCLTRAVGRAVVAAKPAGIAPAWIQD